MIATIEHIYRTCIYLFFHIGKQYRLEDSVIEEVLQESFVSAIHSMHRIEAKNEAGVRGYIVRIFRNKCVDYTRKHVNGSTLFENSHLIHDHREDPLHDLLVREEIRLRDYAVSLISPEKYREPVKLYLEGLSPKDVAKQIQQNRSTTRNLIQRGLLKFETIMLKLDPLRKDS